MEIIPAIDLRGGQCVRLRQGDYQQETVFGQDPVAMAREAVRLGVGEIVLQAMHREGTRDGYDLDTLRAVSAACDVPVDAP